MDAKRLSRKDTVHNLHMNVEHTTENQRALSLVLIGTLPQHSLQATNGAMFALGSIRAVLTQSHPLILQLRMNATQYGIWKCLLARS